MICPVHNLHGLTISREELIWWKDHAEALKICKDCLYWITRQIEIRSSTSSSTDVPLSATDAPGKL